MNLSAFWKPKFIMTAFVQVSGTVFCWMGIIDQGGWITVSTLSLGMFGAASVVENRLMRMPPAAPDA